MGFDDLFIKVMLELIIPPMAFLKWYCFQHGEKTFGISEEKWMRLNRWEKFMTPIRPLSPMGVHKEIQDEQTFRRGIYLEKI